VLLMEETSNESGRGRSARPGHRAASAAASAVALLASAGLAGAVLWGPLPPSWKGFQESFAAGSAAPTGSAAPAAPTSPGPPPPAPATPAAPTDRPTPGGNATRLAAAPPVPVGGGPHTFASFQLNGATPVAYDPCRPVHYVLRPDQAPPGGEEMVHAAVARLSETTGLQFVYDGVTDEQLTADREPFQPGRYGDRWAPVLVVWQTEAENAALAGDVVGQGGSVAVSLGDGPRVYVTGSVTLDAAQFPDILERRHGQATAQGIVLHEFAHLVGLGHVDDDGQLMHPETVPGVTDFQAGDLAGLARLGRGPCAPVL
jgi:hypothetical protein